MIGLQRLDELVNALRMAELMDPKTSPSNYKS